MPKVDRKAVYEKYGGRCAYCGRKIYKNERVVSRMNEKPLAEVNRMRLKRIEELEKTHFKLDRSYKNETCYLCNLLGDDCWIDENGELVCKCDDCHVNRKDGEQGGKD